MPNFNECRAVREDAETITSKASKHCSNTISSLLLSHFSSSSSSSEAAGTSQGKKKSTFRGFGCTAGATKKVSVPAAVRSSANWNSKKTTINILKPKKRFQNGETAGLSDHGEGSSHTKDGRNCILPQDVWCGPVIGFSAEEAVFSPVEKDCVIPRRTTPGGRGRCDVGKGNSREREREREREGELRRERDHEREREMPFIYSRRYAINPHAVPFCDADSNDHDSFGSYHYRHDRHPSPDELAEVVNGLMMLDRFSEWRLDIDEMSYEQLLDLGDKIGYVNTGLKEDEIAQCIRKVKSWCQKGKSVMKEKKCIICQEEFECDDDVGKMICGHVFHYDCLKEWLGHKKCCPVCKCEPLSHD